MVRLAFQIIKNTEIPSLVLSCDNQRYIFNVPETFQRFYREHRVKMTQGPIYFFTRASTETVSGIIGMMLTLFQEGFGKDTKMYGPGEIGDLISVSRFNEVGGLKTLPFSYYDLENMNTKVLGMRSLELVDQILMKSNNCNFEEKLEDVKKIRIEKDIDQSNINDASKLIINGSYEDSNITIIPIQLYQPNQMLQEEQKTGKSLSSIQYAVMTKKFPGKVNTEKLKEYKVEKSKMGIFFKQGFIQLENGSILNVEDIRSPDIIPTLIMILDMSSESEILQLQKESKFINLMKDVQNKSIVLQAFVHLSQPEIIIKDEYQIFLRNFSEYDNILCNFQQQVIDESSLFHQTIVPRSLQICSQFSNYFPNNFPKIKSQLINKINFQEDNQKLLGYFPLYEYTILPIKIQPYGPILNLELDQMVKQFKANQESLDEIIQLQGKVQSDEQRRLTFLGTGSMKPGKYRNVSSNLISQPNNNILLDCGEGTWKQLLDQNIDIIEKPLIIWISHAHSDHHLGMLNLMLQYTNRSTKPLLYVIIPALMLPWFYHYQRLIPSFSQAKFIPIQYFIQSSGSTQELIKESFYSQRIRDNCDLSIDEITLNDLNEQTMQNYNEFKQQLGILFGIKTLLPVPVVHCPQAFGIAITWIDEFKLTYSGDTRPCKSFSDCSLNADLMIHEATFSDELQENAIQNSHATIREAVELAIESNSKNIVLTHFSQRYAKSGANLKTPIQSLNSIPDKYSDEEYHNYLKNKSIYAVDHMGAYFDQFQQLVQISQIVGKLFPEDE